MNGHSDVMKTSISIKNKYSTIVLPLLWVVIDYLAVLLAEQLSFSCVMRSLPIRPCIFPGSVFT